MIHFVGAGPGAADLITMRGAKLLQETESFLSTVNPYLLTSSTVSSRGSPYVSYSEYATMPENTVFSLHSKKIQSFS